MAWRTLGRREYTDSWEKIVIILAGIIGIGSLLFHTFATSWAHQADIIPIWLFVASYTMLIIYRLSAESVGRSIMAILLVAAAMLALRALISKYHVAKVIPDQILLNGSLQYLPVLVALIAFTLLAHVNKHAVRNYLLAASISFLAALAFRSVDIAACTATLGHGTHFLWHLLNGVVVGTLLHALVLKLPPAKVGQE